MKWIVAGWLLLSAGYALAQSAPPITAPSAQELRKLEKAARKGDAQAEYQLGIAAEINNQYATAAKWYRRAAGHGHAQAASALGTLYYTGRGVDPDITVALDWYRQGAERGHPAAQHAYAAALTSAPGDLRNPTAAVQWWEKAARGGHPIAQHNLCMALRDGRGVLQDEETALAWCVVAGPVAEDDVVQMRRRLNQGQVERAYLRAAELRRDITRQDKLAPGQ